MTQSAKAQEPSMEDILASIRRIIADDDTKAQVKAAEPAKPAPVAASRAAAPPPRVSSPPPRPAAPPAPAMNQDDIDTMLSGLDLPVGKSNGSGAEDSRASVLDLTEAMTAPGAPAQPAVFRTIEGHSDVFFAEENGETAPAASPSGTLEEARRQFVQSTSDRPLLSSATSAAVDSAFNTLAHTVLVQNARTLEDLVKEMMRPMLKAWLDDNLPGLVERMVRAEIERVSRGRQG
jgi:cell pole-organizing protein PopZ